MPSSNKAMTGSPTVTTANSAAGGAAACTVTAPSNTTQQLFLYGFWYSADAAPTALTTFTITGLTGGTITIRVPANAYAPVAMLFGTHPLRAIAGSNIVATLGAHGGSTLGSITLLTEVDGAP